MSLCVCVPHEWVKRLKLRVWVGGVNMSGVGCGSRKRARKELFLAYLDKNGVTSSKTRRHGRVKYGGLNPE